MVIWPITYIDFEAKVSHFRQLGGLILVRSKLFKHRLRLPIKHMPEGDCPKAMLERPEVLKIMLLGSKLC